MGLFKKLFSSNNNSDKFSENVDVNNDSKYYKFFVSSLGPRVFEVHSRKYFICCAFCVNLQKSNCHEFCYSCSKGIYKECSSMFPLSFSFVGYNYDKIEDESPNPWIFQTPCTAFERLPENKYFRNFIVSDNSITIGNFEALEGVFLGLCRGKKPCHICASVDIFNNCSKSERLSENMVCKKILNEISLKYNSIMGMIKFVD